MPRSRVIIRKGKVNKQGMGTIELGYNHDNDQAVFATPFRIHYKHWDPIRKEVRRTFEQAQKLNIKLLQLRSELDNHVLSMLLNEEEPTVSAIREWYSKKNEPKQSKKRDKSKSICQLFPEFMEWQSQRVRPITLPSYRTLLSHL